MSPNVTNIIKAGDIFDEITKSRNQWRNLVNAYWALNVALGIFGMAAGVVAAATIFDETARAIAGFSAAIIAGLLSFIKPSSLHDQFSKAYNLLNKPYVEWKNKPTPDNQKILIDAYWKAEAFVR